MAASLSTRFEKAYSVQHHPTFTGLVYGVKPTKKRRELGNMIKLGTTRCGKSTAELCQIVDFDGSVIILVGPHLTVV
jgi:hypothetical protein